MKLKKFPLNLFPSLRQSDLTYSEFAASAYTEPGLLSLIRTAEVLMESSELRWHRIKVKIFIFETLLLRNTNISKL